MCGRTIEAPPRRREEWTGDVRVADADRERAVELLRAHAAVGRLDVDELEERTGTALGARTGRELQSLVRDLPALPPDPARRREAWRAEALTYLAVMVGLVAVWLATSTAHPWPLYPALGWGLPLLLARSRAGTGAGRPPQLARRAATT